MTVNQALSYFTLSREPTLMQGSRFSFLLSSNQSAYKLLGRSVHNHSFLLPKQGW